MPRKTCGRWVPVKRRAAVEEAVKGVDAKRELDLIERVEWRILSASSDEQKLQGPLKVYLQAP